MEMRLEVRLATQPLLNSIRTLAMSGVSVMTATPLAELLFTSLLTRLNINIMDHEVEDHADLGAAGVELRQAMYLDEEGAKWCGLQGQVGRVKAFDVTDL